MRSLFDDTGRDVASLVGAESGAVAATGWDALLQASGIFFNSGTWISVPCASKPETSFRFHPCVLGSAEHQAYTAEQLLLRCTKVLHALLSLSRADASPDGVLDMEACLGDAGFSDALSHLAVLASAHLHSRLERADHGFDVDMLDDGSTGLSATIALQGDVAGRQIEIETLKSCMRPVFKASNSNTQHCPLVVVYGEPGTGKSFLADHVLSRLENQFKANEGEGAAGAVVEYSLKTQARGRDAVRDGLHRMGLALHDKIGVGASASVDDVLGSDSKPPRLRHFLLQKRFVIVADDADTEGCSELLLHVPQSTQPCALVLTSQYGSDIILQLEGSLRSGDLVRIQLQCFEPEVSMQLVDSVCSHDDYALSRGSCWLGSRRF